ncbi:MAG: hypothetical protein AABZ14_08585, partial [Candidatus Margulisiibacteriota bacterium]
SATFRLSEAIPPSFRVDVSNADTNEWWSSTSNWMSSITLSVWDFGGSSLNAVSYIYPNSSQVFIGGAFNQQAFTTNIVVSFSVLNEGVSSITVFVSDNAYNLVSQEVFVIKKDTRPPTVNSSEDFSGSAYSLWQTQNLGYFNTINVSFSDLSSSNIKQISYGISRNGVLSWVTITDNLNQNAFSQTCGIPWSALSDGINELFVSLNDFASNGTTRYLAKVRKDTVAPLVQNNLASSYYTGKWFNESQSFMTALPIQFADTTSMLGSIEYVISSNGFAVTKDVITRNMGSSTFNNSWSINFSSLTNGVNEVYVSVNDLASLQKQQKVFYIQKDMVPPVISSNENPNDPKFSLWYKAKPAFLNSVDVDVLDDRYSLLKYVGYSLSTNGTLGYFRPIIQNQSVTSYNSNWNVDWSAIENGNGPSDLYVQAEDNAGNVVLQKVFSIKRDNYEPIKIDHMPDQWGSDVYNNWYNVAPAWTSSIDIDFSDQGGSGIRSIEYAVSTNISKTWYTLTRDMNNDVYTTNWVLSWNELQEGQNTIFISRNDMITNNLTETLFVFKKDVTSPSYTSNELSTNSKFLSWYKSAPSWLSSVNVAFSDSGYSNLNDAQYILSNNGQILFGDIFQGQDIPTYSSVWPIDWAKLDNGINEVWVSMNDHASNQTKTPILFRVLKDVILPTASSYEVPTAAKFSRWYKEYQVWMASMDIRLQDAGGSLLKSYVLGISNNHTGPMSYVISNNIQQNSYTKPLNLFWSWLGEGLNDFYLTVSDNAGNVVVIGGLFCIKKDDLPPTLNNQINVDTNQWFRITPDYLKQVSINFFDNGDSLLNEVGYTVTYKGATG